MKKNKFKKILKRMNKFRLYKGYASIATIILSNSEELDALIKSSEGIQRTQYQLVPKYHDLEFDIYPYERPADRLARKRKAIKKKIGKTNFKILLGYWTLGTEYFETEEYRILALKKKKKRHNKTSM